MRRVWFAPILSIVVAAGCAPKDKSVVFRGVAYRFPSAHAPKVNPERKDGEGAFASVSPVGEPFKLRFSPRHYRPNAQGAGVPTLHWVNDARNEAQVLRQDDLVVVCKVGSQPRYTCGVQVIDAGLRWAAVFDRDQVAQASAIHAKAKAYLRSYRQAAKLDGNDS